MANKRENSPELNDARQALEIGARIKKEPSSRLVESAFQAELDAQLSLFDALSRVDLAHTLVMTESGVVPATSARELLEALRQLRCRPDDFIPLAAKGDLYTNREAWLAGKTASVAWLGAGRARREAITTAYTIALRERLLALAEALSVTARAMVDRSDDYAGALMPDYTYLQQAQPTTFGHFLLGHAFPLLRDLQRLRGLYPRLNRSPAGCGSSNGSRLPQSRERQAVLLGFEGLVEHARDAMWQADLQIEMAAALSAILVNLDRLAEDLLIFSSEEFSFLELDDVHARASKIMPQKKNPFALTYIRGLANEMIGTLTTAAAMGRTPSGQPDNRLTLYGVLPKAMDDTLGAVELIGEVIGLLKFDEEKGRGKLDSGFSLATDLAEILVQDCGVSFREAHRLVGRLVGECLDEGGFQHLTADALNAAARRELGLTLGLSHTALRRAMLPEGAVAARTEPGGAAVEAMSRMLTDCRRNLEEFMSWAERCQCHLHAADKVLEQALDTCLNSAKAR